MCIINKSASASWKAWQLFAVPFILHCEALLKIMIGNVLTTFEGYFRHATSTTTGALEELLLSQDKLYTLHFRIVAEVIGENSLQLVGSRHYEPTGSLKVDLISWNLRGCREESLWCESNRNKQFQAIAKDSIWPCLLTSHFSSLSGHCTGVNVSVFRKNVPASHWFLECCSSPHYASLVWTAIKAMKLLFHSALFTQEEIIFAKPNRASLNVPSINSKSIRNQGHLHTLISPAHTQAETRHLTTTQQSPIGRRTS